MATRRLVSHAEAAHVLQRVGYSQEQIKDALAQLPDPIDTDRDAETLVRLGMSAENLMQRMGSSP